MFIHADGARSYLLGMNRTRFLKGVIHDVVHKKKIYVEWVKPKYVLNFCHKLLDGKVVCTKGCTQIVIDRIWRSLRVHLLGRSPGANRRLWENRVRTGQWLYWSTCTGLWANPGEMLKVIV